MSIRGALISVAMLLPAALAEASAPARLPAGALARVHPPGHADVAGVARVYLLERLRRARPDIERFELTPLAQPVAADPKAAPPSIAPQPAHGVLLARRACVWVRVPRADGSVRTVPVWFAVQAFRPVLIAQRHFAAHEVPAEEDFIPQQADVAPLEAVPQPVTAALTGLRTRRSVAAGEVLLARDLEKQPEILSGQEVEVTVRVGSVSIHTSAVALREARLGGLVSLRNPSSKLDFVAQVVGQGQAEVMP